MTWAEQDSFRAFLKAQRARLTDRLDRSVARVEKARLVVERSAMDDCEAQARLTTLAGRGRRCADLDYYDARAW